MSSSQLQEPILVFADQDGDPVAVDAGAIVGVSVGTIDTAGQLRMLGSATVTLIWTTGPQPFLVADPVDVVVKRWTMSRVTHAGAPAARTRGRTREVAACD